MDIGILGTGTVGRTIAARLAELGHSVLIGTRDPAKTLAQTEADSMGHPAFKLWLEQNPLLKLGSFAQAAAHGQIIVNATHGDGSLDALKAAGEANLKDKILIDISNPLEFPKGQPPALWISNTDSLAEQIQRAFPDLKVVKSLNTMTAHLMAYPQQLADGNHTVFVSGNDAQAKATVSALLRTFGWDDVLDLGDITTARGPEMYLAIWLRLWGVLQTANFQFKVVR